MFFDAVSPKTFFFSIDFDPIKWPKSAKNMFLAHLNLQNWLCRIYNLVGHVEPNGHVEPKGHAETLFKILKYGLVMLDPMVMLNFLVGCVLDWLC